MKHLSRAVVFGVAACLLCAGAGAQTGNDGQGRLLFQTGEVWSPRTNINADTVLVYGIDPSVKDRIASWHAHGYHVAVMTGVAWGRYGPYLRGEFDGKQHWDETQQEKDGTLRLHSGREVPYVAPSVSYGRYLAQNVVAALDAGAESVYLEEPEFWANAGWSESFKREWSDFYHEPWQAPDSSPDAQYRASKLKYMLYRRALGQVFDAVREYGQAHHRSIPCYVATHSLINYAQWQIVSPESSLLQVGADGYIAQVWTGTSREPNLYDGQLRSRTFETAFLEYGALQNIARSSGKRIWYLNDPIEDNPRHSWTDYRSNWESTLVASLLQPAVNRYEVLPWPDRIFQMSALYPSVEPSQAEPNPPKTRIPEAYATELQTVFHALGTMPATATAQWDSVGTEGFGVLVSDTLMFQRAAPESSDPQLSQFYGLALPLLMRGIPVEPVQIESAAREGNLSRYRVLLLTYEGQKPPTPEFHTALATWVRAGGVLLVMDEDTDPYNRVREWWNSGANHFSTPREHLFQQLGLPAKPAGAQTVGKGRVLYVPRNPSTLSHATTGSDEVMGYVQRARGEAAKPLQQTNALVLRRGPYVIAAGLDAGSAKVAPTTVKGTLVDLFDARLAVRHELTVGPGTRAFLLDVDRVDTAKPQVLAASAKVTDEHATATSLRFSVEGIDATEAAVRVLAAHVPKAVTLDGQPLQWEQDDAGGKTFLLRFGNKSTAQRLVLQF